MTPHTPQLNEVIEIILLAMKERTLDVLLNTNLNDTSQKMVWVEAVHTYKCVRNSIVITSSTKIPFEIFYGEKHKINA